MRKAYCILLAITLTTLSIHAQKPHQSDASEILLNLKKLNFLGTVLYVAAHPDDENTRLIAYFANERLANTAYLSLTRGDGGQNLIGPEIREALGVIRTQELLAARSIDGGEQFYTRANDFGYSKSPEETQEIWNRDEVLGDVVWRFRKFQPDVIITRFPTDGGGGHGHHTASAIFAKEAFEMAANKEAYPDQLKYVDTWQPKRLYLNTGRWWNPNIRADDEGVLTVNIGEYNELLGESYSEMASRSRSQHKSQGFGSTGQRGERLEYLEYRAGDKAETDVFEDIDTSWGRVIGGKKIGDKIDQIITEYDSRKPYKIVRPLIEVRKSISAIKNDYWRTQKLKEVDELIKQASGLYLETTANDYSAAPGSSVDVEVEAINRSPLDISFKSIAYNSLKDSTVSTLLKNNQAVSFETELKIPEDKNYSQPYWLKKDGTLGMYYVEDQKLIGTPENSPAIEVSYTISIEGQEITYTSPLVYKWNDPVDGEKYRPFVILPPVVVNIPESVYIFPGNDGKTIQVTVKAGKDHVSGKVLLDLPNGWTTTPEFYEVQLSSKEEEEKYAFNIKPPSKQSEGRLKAVVELEGKSYNKSLYTLDYDHIKTQVLMPESSSKIVKIDIQKYGERIGYITGAGDVIPSALREIGYDVWEMSNSDVNAENLSQLDAVVLGIRALNTNERLPFFMDDLLNYVNKGGTLVIQYNTSHRLKTNDFSPYPLELSRDRVTDEFAEVEILEKDHPVINSPNKITSEDFKGWVQERGLYFPNEWDDHYDAILSSNDEGETPKKGGLLVAKYGEGHYVYTGFSFFRELPAGVPGAFRLFVNLVSLGNEEKSQ